MKILICVFSLFISSIALGQEAETIRQRANEIRENALTEISAEKHKVTMTREAVKLRQVQVEEMRARLRELRQKENE